MIDRENSVESYHRKFVGSWAYFPKSKRWGYVSDAGNAENIHEEEKDDDDIVNGRHFYLNCQVWDVPTGRSYVNTDEEPDYNMIPSGLYYAETLVEKELYPCLIAIEKYGQRSYTVGINNNTHCIKIIRCKDHSSYTNQAAYTLGRGALYNILNTLRPIEGKDKQFEDIQVINNHLYIDKKEEVLYYHNTPIAYRKNKEGPMIPYRNREKVSFLRHLEKQHGFQ